MPIKWLLAFTVPILSGGCSDSEENSNPSTPLSARQASFVEGALYVEKHPSVFQQSDDHPLLQVADGTVIDSINNVEGCWGSYEEPNVFGVKVQTRFFHFDLANETLTYQLLQRTDPDGLNVPGGIRVQGIYSIESVTDGRIAVLLETTSIEATITTGPIAASDPASATEKVQEVPLTIEGNALRFGGSSNPTVFDPKLVFHRFECPK